MRRHFSAVLIGFVVAVMSNSALAEKVYRWVDKDGKVHYSQTAPTSEASGEKEIRTTPPPTPDTAADEPEERNERGECLTVKCMADQMEADRLKRERGYAEQRAKNERALPKKAEVKPSTVPSGPLSEHDKQLQHNCRRGLYYTTNSRINCDDMDQVRAEWRKYHEAEAERSTRAHENRMRHGL